MATLETARTTNPLEAWRVVMSTCNAPAGANDIVSRWLVLTRACVQPMTLTSAAIAGLLAVRAPGFNLWLFGLAALGIVLAHAGNNLVNDIFDELTVTTVGQQLEFRALAPDDPVERSLLDVLTGEPLHIDEMVRQLELPAASVSSALALLELKGMARHVGGMHYVMTRR